MSRGGESCHVEDISEGFSTSSNGAFSVSFAAVIIEGCDPDECGDFLSVELSEFREFGDECCGGDIADSGDGLEEFESLLPVVIGQQQFENGSIEPEDV
jgi:hypothetical protein